MLRPELIETTGALGRGPEWDALLARSSVVTVEPVGEFALKGIRRPMVANNVLVSAPKANSIQEHS